MFLIFEPFVNPCRLDADLRGRVGRVGRRAPAFPRGEGIYIHMYIDICSYIYIYIYIYVEREIDRYIDT